jgi:two-component system sensor histidine kinase KdpD
LNQPISVEDLLSHINYEKEAPLRIYLGGSPGVGKTYRMLQDGNALKSRGVDVVIGYVEGHDRADTLAQVGSLEVIPRKLISYRGREFEEMDTQAIIARKPQLAIVDELAHTNIPGAGHEKRYQDIEDLLAAGIAVFSTCNVQHLESVHDIVERLTGVEVQERVPDTFFGLAKEVIMVDVSVEELQERLKAGKIYKPDKIEHSLKNFFTHANISLLREMALREVANDIEQKDKEQRQVRKGDNQASGSSEKVMVAIAARPDSKNLIRFGSRMAGRINAKWYVVYVNPQPAAGQTEEHKAILQENLKLAKLLGAKVVSLSGRSITQTLRSFAEEEGITQIVLGATQRPWWRRLLSKSVVTGLLQSIGAIAVHIIPLRREIDEGTEPREEEVERFSLTNYLPPEYIIPNLTSVATVEQTIALLIDHLITRYPNLSPLRSMINESIMQRERVMSTFLETGIAIPHAAGLEEITDIYAVMALTPKGVISLGRDQKASIVLLFISPEVGRTQHLKFLAAAASVFLDQTSVREISGCITGQDAVNNILRIENIGSRHR